MLAYLSLTLASPKVVKGMSSLATNFTVFEFQDYLGGLVPWIFGFNGTRETTVELQISSHFDCWCWQSHGVDWYFQVRLWQHDQNSPVYCHSTQWKKRQVIKLRETLSTTAKSASSQEHGVSWLFTFIIGDTSRWRFSPSYENRLLSDSHSSFTSCIFTIAVLSRYASNSIQLICLRRLRHVRRWRHQIGFFRMWHVLDKSATWSVLACLQNLLQGLVLFQISKKLLFP